jgi:dipeptidyl aminopeptidase/acylaminoacyl peptidase
MNKLCPVSGSLRLSVSLFALLALPLACACVQAASGQDQSSRFPNNEDLRHLKGISAPELSPDGKQVLFTMTDATADGAKSHIWLVPIAGGTARQLTYSPSADKRGEHNAIWSPDGSAIFFLAKRGENTQLFRLPLAGGEASPYDLKIVPTVDDSKEKDAIPPAKPQTGDSAKVDAKTDAKVEPIAINPGGFAVSPDSHWLAVWASDPETPGEKKAKEAKADAVWVNHERHGERLYLAGLKADGTIDGKGDGALKAVALAPDVHAVSWSPKSDRLAVVTDLPNEASDLGPAATAWLVTIGTTGAIGTPLALNSVPATVRGGFGWSLDGTEIVFAAQTPEDAPPGVEELFALALPDANSGVKTTEKNQAHRLTANFKGAIAFGEPVYLPNGKVLAAVAEGTRVTAVQLSLDGKAAPVSMPQSTSIISGMSTNHQQTGWVWMAEGSDHPESLCYAATLGGECKTLPMPELATQHFRAVKSQLIQWQSDGLTIEGLLYLPPEAATKKVPLIIDVHGGPLGAWEDRYEEWTGFLIGHGWAILRPNPRGSSAYGVKFAAANKNDLGGGDFRDVMVGVDFALKKYPIDSNKLALMGYSYGGEMAGFAEGKTDRFKAIISGAPVIDQFSEYGTERGSWYDRWYYGKPWEHVEDTWRQSPLSGATKAKTPFLLIQGQEDGTDPLGQSEEMYRALRQAGVPVEMVTYPREDHGPLARGIFGYPSVEPWHGFDGRQRIVQFLQKGFGEEKIGGSKQ